jgi:hypothetical protein
MLIHIGNDDFLHLDDIVGIFSYHMLTADMQKTVFQALGPLKPDTIRSVILTRTNRWHASLISTEALAGKRLTDTFPEAFYSKFHEVQELKS